MINLDSKEKQRVIDILRRNISGCEVRVFGSRMAYIYMNVSVD